MNAQRKKIAEKKTNVFVVLSFSFSFRLHFLISWLCNTIWNSFPFCDTFIFSSLVHRQMKVFPLCEKRTLFNWRKYWSMVSNIAASGCSFVAKNIEEKVDRTIFVFLLQKPFKLLYDLKVHCERWFLRYKEHISIVSVIHPTGGNERGKKTARNKNSNH